MLTTVISKGEVSNEIFVMPALMDEKLCLDFLVINFLQGLAYFSYETFLSHHILFFEPHDF
jgi:hypothetical protein